jgi:hypothetical protein
MVFLWIAVAVAIIALLVFTLPELIGKFSAAF